MGVGATRYHLSVESEVIKMRPLQHTHMLCIVLACKPVVCMEWQKVVHIQSVSAIE